MAPILGIIASSISKVSYWIGYLADSQSAASQFDNSYGVVIDSTNNIYVTGQFKNASGGTNAFIVKYNSLGVIQWQRSLADSLTAASQNTLGRKIAIDSSDNIYVSGYFQNASNGLNAFIVKYNSSGTLQWQRKLNSSNAANVQIDDATCIAVDSSSNVYIGGNTRNSSAGTNAFIVKYNSSGTLQWQRKLSDSLAANLQQDSTWGIGTDSSGNVYIAGQFLNAFEARNAFIIKYNSSGTLQWQRKLNDANAANLQNELLYGLSVDGSDNVYVTGSFKNASAGQNAFIVKYNSSGTLQWQRSLADSASAASQNDYGWAMSFDSSNNVYATGNFNLSGSYTYIVKYNSSGTIQWQRSLADTTSTPSTSSRAIKADSSTNVYSVGQFKNTSNGFNAYSSKIPNDGSKTGTWTIDSSHILAYATSSLTDAAGSLTDAAGALTDAAGALTDAAGTLTDASLSLTNAKVSI